MIARERGRVVVDATLLRGGSGLYGIGRVTFDLLKGLAKTRDEWRDRLEIVAVASLDDRGRAEVSSDLAGVAEASIEARGTASSRLDWSRRLHLDRVAREAGARLLHIPEAKGTPLRATVPRVVTCHDLISLRDPRHYLGVCLRYPDDYVGWRAGYALSLARELRRFKGARRVVAISKTTADDAVRLLRLDPARVDVVPNGVDLERWTKVADAKSDATIVAKAGLGARPFALYVGACDYRKNVPVMLAAIKRARSLGVDLELAWAGALPEWKLAAVRRQVEEAGLTIGREVKMLGFVADDDLPALYRAALAHLFVSRIEGFGLTVVEAMLAGCPAIVARGSGCDELGGDAVFVVDADDAVAAADVLARLARDRSQANARVELGRARALDFGRDRMARGYVESFVAALTQSG